MRIYRCDRCYTDFEEEKKLQRFTLPKLSENKKYFNFTDFDTFLCIECSALVVGCAEPIKK